VETQIYCLNLLRIAVRSLGADNVRKDLTEGCANPHPPSLVTIATALIAAVGWADSFSRGRDLAAWLGLVPRQSTTGGRPCLLGISKRGNKYLRRLFIHGARAALPHVAERDTPLGRWAKGLLGRAHQNVAVVALANKLVRIAWAVLRRGQRFDHRLVQLTA
jgi:transposase